ncbi:MAG TPA: histidinol dehydrogenase, partial [Candidatus Limnocylindria bacterium]
MSAIRIRDVAAMRRDVLRRRGADAFTPALLAAARRTIAEVRRRGDAAALASVRRFDHRGATHGDLWADRSALRRAGRTCAPELRAALDEAYDAILSFHRAQRPKPIAHRRGPFHEALVPQALGRVGGCVPRGTVGYPST